MRVILREDMDNLGNAGEVVSVRPGYGRNYLLPRGLAVQATEKDVARLEHEKRVIAARNAKRAKELEGEVAKLSKVSVEIARAVGEGDKLYGSVTSRDIADALAEKGVTVDSKKIQLAEPIKTLGETEVKIRLATAAVATIKVTVSKKD
jgi:large subunit ribosomal protein L9